MELLFVVYKSNLFLSSTCVKLILINFFCSAIFIHYSSKQLPWWFHSIEVITNIVHVCQTIFHFDIIFQQYIDTGKWWYKDVFFFPLMIIWQPFFIFVSLKLFWLYFLCYWLQIDHDNYFYFLSISWHFNFSNPI